MSILPKTICRFNAIPIKIPMTFSQSQKTRKNNAKIYIEPQKETNRQTNPRTVKANLKKQKQKNKADFRLYAKATVWKQYSTWTKNRYEDQRNRIESPEINSGTYGQLIYGKRGKNIQWRKDSFFSKWRMENWTATYKRMKLKHFLTAYTKINSKWIKDLNVRPQT